MRHGFVSAFRPSPGTFTSWLHLETLVSHAKVGAACRTYITGQPTHESHPELLLPGELTPGIQASEYAARREALLRSMPSGSCAVIPAASVNYMSGIIPYPYRQDADFSYLTGLQQRAVALLQPGQPADWKWPGGSSDSISVQNGSGSGSSSSGSGSCGSLGSNRRCHYSLFIEPPDEERDRWDGETLDKEAAALVFGADEVHYVAELPQRVKQAAYAASAVYFDMDNRTSFRHPQTLQALGAAAQAHRIHPLRPLMHTMRLCKSPAEQMLLGRSARVAAEGLRMCMAGSAPGVHEFALASTFEHAVKMAGAARVAYPTIAAGGASAFTTHYGRNDKRVQEGQMVLMDAGCEHSGYCSDVSRTWPVNGRYEGVQRDVYSLVLDVHHRCLDACKPGASIRSLHQLSVQLLSEGIHDMGFLGSDKSLSEIEQQLYKQFYWHSVGHWLGLDTHDTHLMGHDRPFVEGHVITVEPGLYIPDQPQFGRFAGMGVRIEDDVRLTASGCEVLSRDVPIAMDEIEHLVGSGPRLVSVVSAGVPGGRADRRTEGTYVLGQLDRHGEDNSAHAEQDAVMAG